MTRACITGGAGFIGSNLADRLRADGWEVVIVDNFSSGRREFVSHFGNDPAVTIIEGDVLDHGVLEQAFTGCEWIFHMQANADVRRGLEHPRRDLEQNTIATANVLEAMLAAEVKKLAFASTGSVYGEPNVFPTPEDAPFPVQTSLYGASKLAAEGMIAAYSHGFEFTGLAFRCVSVLGERYTHGHVVDFYRSLRENPQHLAVLGDGAQTKSYLYVRDCVDAMQLAVAQHTEGPAEFEVYNLGTDETVSVRESIETICAFMGLSPTVEYSGGMRGWPGDSPQIHLDCTKLRTLGWEPRLRIRDALVRTLRWLDAHPNISTLNTSVAPKP